MAATLTPSQSSERMTDSGHPDAVGQMTRPRPRMRLSTSRLAMLFIVIFAAGVTLVLTAVYFLTARVLDQEVDAVINSEVNNLVDDYSRGGLLQLVATLHRRADGWGRTGAVYLLVESNGFPIAGNLAAGRRS